MRFSIVGFPQVGSGVAGIVVFVAGHADLFARKDGIDVQTMISIPAEVPDSPYRYVRPGALHGWERETINQKRSPEARCELFRELL